MIKMSVNGPTVSMHERLKADFCALILNASVLSGQIPEIYVPLHHLTISLSNFIIRHLSSQS